MNTETTEIQKAKDGKGPLYHRIYSIVIPVPFSVALDTMARFQTNTNDFSPQTMARFEKIKGGDHLLQAGDCFQIHITGPWNGPVTVCEAAQDRFRFKTLEGHLEAGEIRFRVQELDPLNSLFEIESMARSKDAIIDFIYDKIPLIQFAQANMWEAVCKNFASVALKTHNPEEPELQKVGTTVQVVTERKDEETGEWESL